MSDSGSLVAARLGSRATADASRRRDLDRLGAIAYWTLAAVPVVVTLFLPALALTDGGLHLASATAVNGLLDGRWPGLVQWTASLPPNVTMEALLAVLIRVMDAEWALRLVACLLLLGFAAAAAALVRALGAPTVAAMLFLPFQAHAMFQTGQLGFTAAVALALALVALVLRHPTQVPPVKLGALLALTWLTHIFPALLAMVAVVGIVLLRSLRTTAGARVTSRLVQAFRTAFRQLALPSLPAVALSVAWVLTVPVFGGSEENPPHDLVHSAKNVIGMTWPTLSYSRVELSVYRFLALLLYATALAILVQRIRAYKRGESRGTSGLRDADGLLAAVLVAGAAAIVMPDASANGAGMLAVRTSLFVPLFLVAWIVANRDVARAAVAGRRMRLVAIAAPLAVAVVAVGIVTAVRLPGQSALGVQVRDLRGLARCVPEGSTTIQLDLADAARHSEDRYAMVLQSGLIAADRNLLALDNESGWYPYYTWKFTETARADRLQTERSGMGNTPPDVALGPAVQAGLPLDAVILYGRTLARPEDLADPRSAALLGDLSAHFRQVAVSDHGAWELWLRTGVAAACRS